MTKTAREIRKELAAKNSEARALRRALKEAEKAELLSAKTALGEALAAVVFADNADAMQALIPTLNEPAITDNLRRILGVNNTENDALEEPQDEAQWASAERRRPGRNQCSTGAVVTALYHLEQTELAQVWRGGTALRSSPVTLERSESVFDGVKDTMSCRVAKRGYRGDIVSFAGAMGWAAKQGPTHRSGDAVGLQEGAASVASRGIACGHTAPTNE